jgi:hypothetical protein
MALVGTAAAFPRMPVAELDNLIDESPGSAARERAKRGTVSGDDGSD